MSQASDSFARSSGVEKNDVYDVQVLDESSSSINKTELEHTQTDDINVLGIFKIPKDLTTKRQLSGRQSKLIALGSCIGTAVFISTGSALSSGGPFLCLLSYIVWCTVVYATNVTLSEMTVYLPIDSSWIIYITRWLDDGVGVGNAWNFTLGEATLVCYEITAFGGTILPYWTSDFPVWLPIVLILISYIVVECVGIKLYGEVEFFMSIFKVVLITALIFYTFFTMVGANPERDVYGFRNWHPEGGIWPDYRGDGGSKLSHFEGFLNALIIASFTVLGPDYLSLIAGELQNPRKHLPYLFKSILIRLFVFFIIGTLCVTILVPYNNPQLLSATTRSARSPYIISMQELHVKVFPHIVNAVLCTTVYSSGNGFFFCASRSLYGLAKEGKAPKFFAICLKNGAPIGSVLLISAISCLALLQLGTGSVKVLGWFTSISTCSLLLYMCLINAAYLRFRDALDVQGIAYSSLPLTHKGGRYYAWYAVVMNFIMLFVQGYGVFKPGMWDVSTFIFNYFMVFLVIAVAVFWKIYKRTGWIRLEDMDLTTGLEEIAEHERTFVEPPPSNAWLSRALAIIF